MNEDYETKLLMYSSKVNQTYKFQLPVLYPTTLN